MEYYSQEYMYIFRMESRIYYVFSSVRLISRQIVTYIKSPITKIQLQTFFVTTLKKKLKVQQERTTFFMVEFGHVLGNEMC